MANLDDIPDKRPQVPAIKGLTVDTGEIPITQFDDANPYTSLLGGFATPIATDAIRAGKATARSLLQDVETFGGIPLFALNEVICIAP